MEFSIPLSEYASKLEEHVKQRYLQKMSSIGVNPALIEGKLTLRTRQPDCLPPMESIDLLLYLDLETSFYAQQQFKVFRSLQSNGFRVYCERTRSYPCRQVCCFGQSATLQYSLTFRALTFRQREIRHRISGESRVTIAIIHAVNIRETVDNEMAKRYAKSGNAMLFSLLSH